MFILEFICKCLRIGRSHQSHYLECKALVDVQSAITEIVLHDTPSSDHIFNDVVGGELLLI